MSDENGVPPELAMQIVLAAERADRFAFTAAARRLGSIEDAQALVRSRGIVRMVDRVAIRAQTTPAVREDETETRAADVAESQDDPIMHGHFSVFDEWTEIDSYFEGHFLERIAPGAYKKTFRENRNDIKPLFQHGYDPQVGDKPLGPIADLREDETGAYYEVALLDAPYVRNDILPGLKAGLYGASFRFQMIREDFNAKPERSDHNPDSLPERTLKELRVFEFGPVTFPAYPSATAGVRSEPVEDNAPATADAENDEHLPERDAAESPHLARTARRVSQYRLIKKEKPTWLL
jgi:HK97 family phage prohead protease